MSKKRPNGEAEIRWRANHRLRRLQALFKDEAAIGDPIGLVASAREQGRLALPDLAVIATTPRATPRSAR